MDSHVFAKIVFWDAAQLSKESNKFTHLLCYLYDNRIMTFSNSGEFALTDRWGPSFKPTYYI